MRHSTSGPHHEPSLQALAIFPPFCHLGVVTPHWMSLESHERHTMRDGSKLESQSLSPLCSTSALETNISAVSPEPWLFKFLEPVEQ